MRFGSRFPQYDYSVRRRSSVAIRHDRRARAVRAGAGFDSVWLSDHLFLDIGKYGGPRDREACFDPSSPGGTGAARARVRLGTLVFCEALRPAAVLAKGLATLDRVSGGPGRRGDRGGLYEPEYESIAMRCRRHRFA